MPHQALKLIPGVDQNRTLALNEAAISNTNLVRFIPDRQGLGLVQKLGGWTKFVTENIGSTPRALWAWEDTNNNAWLGVGAESSLSAIVDGGVLDITPQTTTANISVSFNTTAGSDIITIDATGSGLDAYDVVDIRTQVSVGGLVLFGLYQVYPVSSDQFQIHATDFYGNPVYATGPVPGGGAVPVFDVTSGSAVVTVTLADHGFVVGDTFPILVSTNVGGLDLYGNYIVSSVTSSDEFTFNAKNSADTNDTQSENGGDVQFIYYNGVGPAPINAGYGHGGYGTGGYGAGSVSPSIPGTPITAQDWTLDNWGEIFISNPLNGPVYNWSPTQNNPIATVIPTAPSVNAGVLVAMPQRQIIAWGSTFNGIQDQLLIRWTDVDNYTSWAGTVTNQAGSFRLSKGSKIVECIQGPQQTLVWTDLGVWSMQYVGPPYVYQFNEIGTGCGLIGRKAAASMNGVVYWMGQSQFFRLGGGGVEPITCPIWDVIFQDLDTNNLNKIRVAPNSRFGEISWYYPTTSSNGEIAKYVKYNIILNQWDFGTLSRTAWINESVLGPPIGGAPNGFIYQHRNVAIGVLYCQFSYVIVNIHVNSETNMSYFVHA